MALPVSGALKVVSSSSALPSAVAARSALSLHQWIGVAFAVGGVLSFSLRPVIIKDPSLNGDFAASRAQLPGENFFSQTPEAQPLNNLPQR